MDILVLRALGLGDFLTGVPALRALRRHHPDARLRLLAPAWQAPFARQVGVDAVINLPGLVGLPDDVERPTLAVDLHGKGPRSVDLLAETRPQRLIAFGMPDGPRWRWAEHEVRRWCRLLDESGIPSDPDDLLLDPPQTASLVAPGTVVVHPGAAAPGRRWPVERFAAIVAWLESHEVPVALTGTADESSLCRSIVGLAGTCSQVLAGHTDMMSLAATVAASRVVVTNDTGVAHMATAMATPSVVLFGPTPPAWWGPPPRPIHRVLWRGRLGDPHALTLDPGLARIGVEDVQRELQVLLDMTAGGDGPSAV